MNEERCSDIKRYGKAAKGRSEILRHLAGDRLTRGEAIMAKCYECEGYYLDGKVACSIGACPLQPFNPYAK